MQQARGYALYLKVRFSSDEESRPVTVTDFKPALGGTFARIYTFKINQSMP